MIFFLKIADIIPVPLLCRWDRPPRYTCWQNYDQAPLTGKFVYEKHTDSDTTYETLILGEARGWFSLQVKHNI